MKRFGQVALLSVCTLLAPSAALVLPVAAAAQADAVRSLTGDVTDKSGAKVKGAVVHLKDTRTLAQRSYITADDGTFRFAQLSGGSDYEVWADLNGRKTPSKTISSFDSKKAVELSLKLPD